VLSRRLYDTSAVIDLVLRKDYKVVPGAVSIITVIEWPPVLNYVNGVLYPTKSDYAKAVELQVRVTQKGRTIASHGPHNSGDGDQQRRDPCDLRRALSSD